MRLNLLGSFDKYTGYGRHSTHMARALTSLGVSVRPITLDTLQMPHDLQRNLGISYDVLTIALIAAQDFPSLPGRMWGYSMWETTVPPKEQVENINDFCTRYIVPSEWLVEVYQNAGVERPIHVLPEGIDPNEFPYIERNWEHDRPYTFLCLGDRAGRKGDDLAWSAFFEAFQDEDDVRLIIKCTHENHAGLNLTNTDTRVSLWRGDVDSMRDVYAQADCFVFPSRGEGWGLPAREAAATGMPVLATRWSGLVDNIDRYAIPLQYEMVDAPIIGGQWAQPKLDDVVRWMRWCYENREEAKAFGKRASEWLHANETWRHSAQKLIEIVEGNHAAIRRATV
jgi:glycosyltransferase involved in cell wall biosynthesis